MIPKILHQTYPSTQMPPVLARNIAQLREMNPGWKHRFYDDAAIETFIARHYPPAVMAAYRSIDPVYGAARADLFRYLLMYVVGGVYLDIKSSTARPLDSVLHADDSYVLSHWENAPGTPHAGWGITPELPLKRGELQQWHIIAEPRHPILKAVINAVLRNIANYDMARDGVGKAGVLRTTGPIAYTLAILTRLGDAPHRMVRTHKDLGLVYSVMSQEGVFAHQKALFKTHYSKLTTPIVMRPSPAAPAPG